MEDGPVQVFPWNLFLSEVGAGHLNKSPPGAFYEAVGTLSIGGSDNDLGLVVVDPLEALATHEFLVEASVESAGEMADVRSKLGEGVDDLVGCGGLEAVKPEVLGCTVD